MSLAPHTLADTPTRLTAVGDRTAALGGDRRGTADRNPTSSASRSGGSGCDQRRDLLAEDVLRIYDGTAAVDLWRPRLRSGPTGVTLVAVHPESGVVGLARTRVDGADRDGRGHLASLYIHPAAQGSGVCGRLHAAALDALRAAGYRRASLRVFAGNTAAQRFYRRHGWSPDGATRVEEDYRVPEMRMLRDLST